MANPIIECVQATGLTIYVLHVNRLTGQVWNTATPGWESFNASHWANYAVTLAEFTGAGYYWAARPTGVAGSLVSDVPYVQAGGSPAISDKPPFGFFHNEGENVAAINADPAVAPQNLAQALQTALPGTVAAGTITNSSFPTSITGLANNLLVGRTMIFGPTAANPRAAVSILAYNGSTGVFTVSPLVGAPSVSDPFIIE